MKVIYFKIDLRNLFRMSNKYDASANESDILKSN